MIDLLIFLARFIAIPLMLVVALYIIHHGIMKQNAHGLGVWEQLVFRFASWRGATEAAILVVGCAAMVWNVYRVYKVYEGM